MITIHENENTGILNLSEGLHKIDISAKDADQNESVLSFYVKVVNPSKSKRASELKLIEYPTISSNFDYDIMVLEKGIVFLLNTSYNKLDEISSYIETDDKLLSFPLFFKNGKYMSELIGFDKLLKVKNMGLLFHSDKIYKYEFDIKPKLILPNTNYKIFSNDSLVTIDINDTFYDTTLFWIIKNNELSDTYNKNTKSSFYEIFPKGIPIKNKYKVSFNFNNENNIDNYAVYSYIKKKKKWNYIKSDIDTSSIYAILLKPQIIGVFEDNQRPWFNYTFPKSNQTYTIKSIKNILILLDDNLSGIYSSEEKLQVFLDGKRLWVAYQPVKKEISYTFRNLLSIGEHNLKIIIHDRSGNSASKSIKFFVE
jgi:hypothetical protein